MDKRFENFFYLQKYSVIDKCAMAQPKHVLRFAAIANLFCNADERKLISRGENAVDSNHVESFLFDPETMLIRGKIHASMRDRLYNVEVHIDEEGEISDASCDCPRGQYLCHHMAALCIYGHHNISVTDVACSWSARKTKKADIQTIEEIYGGKTHRSTKRDLSDEEIGRFRERLQECVNAVGFSWLLQPEPTVVAKLLVNIEDFLFSEEYFSAQNKALCLTEKLRVSLETIRAVCESTVGQSKNEMWLQYRTNRLTASNFGFVLAAVRRNRYPPSLYKRLTGFYSLEGVSAVQWGITNEPRARDEFTAATQKAVVLTGLWLHPCGFLGASPDGLVEDNAIIEIKCPYKFRDQYIRQALKTDHSYIVNIREDDQVVLNQEHDYYHQIQGNLMFTGREICFLVIWSSRDFIIVEINKDEEWKQNVDLLEKFYVEQYVPHITGTA